LIAAGWGLEESGPMRDLLLLVDERPTRARAGAGLREDLVSAFPAVPGAAWAGWEATVDIREAAGPSLALTLLGRTGDGEWIELDRCELRVEEPRAASPRRRAVFTIARNEGAFLPIWLSYYGRHFAAGDTYVLDDASTDGSIEELAQSCRVLPVRRDEAAQASNASLLIWLKGTVEDFQRFLLRSYDAVLFCEVDELVVADPERYPNLGAYIDALDGPAATCSGYNVVHHPEEPPLRFEEPVLRQRRFWHRSPHWYSKRLLARIPLSWSVGFHDEYNAPAVEPDPDLYLIHLHRVDYDYCLERHRRSAERRWSESDLRFNLSWHKRIAEPDEFRDWFFAGADLEAPAREEIPDRFRDLA
jgi:hypothetical protein